MNIKKIESDFLKGLFSTQSFKYTKYFSANAEYMVAGHKDPVYVYENDDLVGIICPVNFMEGVK